VCELFSGVGKKDEMQGSVLQILFLGENSTWSTFSQALLDDPDTGLQLQRVESLTELFRALIDGRWHALAVDIHAWNFRGLHYLEKVRAQYPALPIVALHSGTIPELDAKASACGASRCISFENLDARSLRDAVESVLADARAEFLVRRDSESDLTLSTSDGVTLTFSKTQVITHALNNLLCVISANADILADKLDVNGREARPLFEIKKAARSAAALMRHLK
jgi:DNA-binding NtrC family response regulator